MRSDELVALAAARGVDLTKAARQVCAPAKWTSAELSEVSQGIPPLVFAAACFALAGDRGGYWKLHAALSVEAAELARRRHWPRQVLDLHGLPRPYLKHLAKLVLDEDEHRNLFEVCQPLYAIYLGFNEDVWDKQVAARFAEVKSVWLGWLAQAGRIMQPGLASGEDSPTRAKPAYVKS